MVHCGVMVLCAWVSLFIMMMWESLLLQVKVDRVKHVAALTSGGTGAAGGVMPAIAVASGGAGTAAPSGSCGCGV
jgi:hypothetical protein